MREIKFRQLLNDGTWHYWGYINTHFSSPVGLNNSTLSSQQYTGLKDNNGVEIYEGDLLRAKHDDGRYDVGEVVYGSKGAFCLYLTNVATGIKTPLLNYIHGIMFSESDFEVIGNIYENPELLK